jgi:hypothetical protein
MDNLTDPLMEFISRDVCTSLGYQCFVKGFYEQNYAETKSDIQSTEIEESWNVDFFKHSENNEWVIWFLDTEGDENYFGEFWLSFAEEKREAAENAYQRICEFLRENVENTGKVPPHILDGKLYEIIDSIWGKNSGRYLPNVETAV